MDPQIQYARTDDGVSIACYAIGSGPVVVRMMLPFSHLQAELRDPSVLQTHETIARLGTLVRYDHRGFGLSDRDVTRFQLDALVLDLEAVVERLGLDRFVLLVNGAASPVALQYVASNPGRVTRLVLYPGFARTEGVAWKQWQSLAQMAHDDWQYVSEAAMRATYGWEEEELSRRDAELLRQSVTPQTFIRYLQDLEAWDASDAVAEIRVPTLLLQAADARYTTMEVPAASCRNYRMPGFTSSMARRWRSDALRLLRPSPPFSARTRRPECRGRAAVSRGVLP